MPKGPRGEKRPADAIARAVQIRRIATGEIEDVASADGKTPPPKLRGKGRQGAASRTTAKKRSEIAERQRRSCGRNLSPRLHRHRQDIHPIKSVGFVHVHHLIVGDFHLDHCRLRKLECEPWR